MRKNTVKVLSMLLAIGVSVSSMMACSPQMLGEKVEVDETKTQLFVGNNEGGMGSRWLDAYKKGFEAKYADVSFEAGKKGVEVVVLNDKTVYGANLQSTIDKSDVNVVFSEMVDYHQYVEFNLLYDISDVVKATIPGESKSIEDKLSADQKTYYGLNAGTYYALPHYQTLRGIVYDIDLFNQHSLYFKNDGSISGKSTDTDLGKGPDGKAGTYDDGLPATFAQFYELCEYMSVYKNITPICWNGTYGTEYTEHVRSALKVDIEGYTAASFMRNYNENSQPITAKLVNSFDASGKPVVESKTITMDNYKDLKNSAGEYFSLEFLDTIVKNNWYYKMSLNSTQSNEIMQYDFLRSRFDPDIQPIAMMMEGTWWEEEAAVAFDTMEKDYDGASRNERSFGLMPFPKATEEFIGAPTLYDGNKSIVFVNGNCSEVKADIAKKFIQYISTNDSLIEFLSITGVFRDYDMEYSASDLAKISPNARSLVALRDAAEGIVYGYPLTTETYRYHLSNKISQDISIIDGVEYWNPLSTFLDAKNITARQYFEGLK